MFHLASRLTVRHSLQAGKFSFSQQLTAVKRGQECLVKAMSTTATTTSTKEPKLNASRQHAADLFKKRTDQKAKRKAKNFLILNNADLRVLGSNCQSFGPSLLVHSEGSSYLFNCSEGFQRLCYSNKVSLLELGNVFITHHDWRRVSGLFGLSLTLQDAGLTTLSVHSAPGIEDIFSSTRNFMQFTTGIKTEAKTFLEGDYEDSSIKIHPIPIDAHQSSIGEHPTKRQRTQQTQQLIAYVCTLPDLPGALNAQKCKELRVPIGKELAVLKSGQDITLKDGTLVRSVDVCEPKKQGLQFLVVDCPKESHVESVITNVELNKFRSNRALMQEREIAIVAHFAPYRVINNSKYSQWMDGFPSNCKHIILSPKEPSKINFIDVYHFQYLLNKLDCEIFPELSLPPKIASNFQKTLEEHLNETEEDYMGEDLDPEPVICRSEYEKLGKVIEMNMLDKLVIRPHLAFETVENPKRYDALYKELKLDLNFENVLSDLRKAQQNLPQANDYEPELVFLGTGSALPSKLRSTSCILLNFRHPFEASVLMDCGEDSYGQLFRMYGPKRTSEILKQLKLVYVSHHHADHHIGLAKLLAERKKVTDEPVILLLPPGIESLLNYHNKNFEDLTDTYEIFTTSPLKTSPSTGSYSTPISETNKQTLKQKLNGLLDDITVVGVNHCFHACAVTMRFKINHPDMDTFTVAYSGDARPSLDFILAAKDCDLLIHEATFDFRSEDDALSKRHCTTTEAIQVAKKMNAKFTILTHFSQRYSKIPYFTEEFDETIGFAFDNLVLKCPSHFPRLPILKPVLSLAFRKSLDEIDAKYFRTQAKQRVIQELVAADG